MLLLSSLTLPIESASHGHNNASMVSVPYAKLAVGEWEWGRRSFGNFFLSCRVLLTRRLIRRWPSDSDEVSERSCGDSRARKASRNLGCAHFPDLVLGNWNRFLPESGVCKWRRSWLEHRVTQWLLITNLVNILVKSVCIATTWTNACSVF